MPWRQVSPMDQRTQFIADHLRDARTVTELCALYGVSRKTGYKWIDRYLRHGPAGLEEHSRRPHRAPNQTPDEIVAAILEVRRRHPSWGGKKLLALLHRRHPRWPLPGRSTACDILRRHGLVPTRRQRRRIGHPGKPPTGMLAPNDVWSADYKGQFRTGDGRYCYPLTVADGFSRYLVGCQGGWGPRLAPRPSRSLPGSSTSTACRSGSEPTTACRLRPPPWPGCPRSRRGGCASASSRSSSSRAGHSRTGGMNACIAP